ncbi:TPA: hypothetical protein ACNH9H_000325 [Pseudomonas aeruginosa]|uniref:hypothetical protein n=1 Tax=Pseudomonas aeruginosa TaxID=287 RepID=UPI0022EA9356|nr:hypothetical protein [Pseudomonas aeruginosa]EKV0422539.1 hypothetical protein [Pseudomonas aeruginosa]MDA3369737.1 hypothetical protein [Pseudomonas aeruginosa]
MAEELRPLAWATIYSSHGKEDIVEIGDANPVQERMADSFGLQHRRVQLVEIPAGHVVVSEDLLRRIERECRRESDWNCENVPAGTNAATTRAKKMLEIANDLRDLLGEQEEGNDVSNHQ